MANNQYFTKQKIFQILSDIQKSSHSKKQTLSFKKPLNQLPLEDIAESLNWTYSEYFSLSREIVKSKLKEAKEEWKKNIQKSDTNLKKMQKNISGLRQCLKELRSTIPDHDNGFWPLPYEIKDELEEKIKHIEDYTSDRLEIVKRCQFRVGAPRDENAESLIFGLTLAWTKITNRKPSNTPGNAFMRFIHDCMYHAGVQQIDFSRHVKKVLSDPLNKRIFATFLNSPL